jgi:uncharacterized membrane protein YtjA (UPF0391 family)
LASLVIVSFWLRGDLCENLPAKRKLFSIINDIWNIAVLLISAKSLISRASRAAGGFGLYCRGVWQDTCCNKRRGEKHMLWYTWVFLVIALIAAVLGFGGVAAASAGIAKICFIIFLVLFLVSILAGRRSAL